MYLLLSLLLLPAPVAPALFSQYYNNDFMMLHTYHGNSLPDCSCKMNEVLHRLNKQCDADYTIILGDSFYYANIYEVQDVCSSFSGIYKGDSKQGGKIYESKKNFRVVKCRWLHGSNPPGCTYSTVSESDIKTQKITVTCDGARPVHLHSS